VYIDNSINSPICRSTLNPFIATLKRKSNGPYSSNTVPGILAIDGSTVTFGTAKGDWVGSRPLLALPNVTVNGQCTNFVLFDVAL